MPVDDSYEEKNDHTILLVDDHPIFRSGLSELINQIPNISVCGETDNSNDALVAVEKLNPDLVIVDINLKDSNGIELTKALTSRYKELPVLILSINDESVYAERVLNLGASGYIMKHEANKSVEKAILKVLSGKKYISEKETENLADKLAKGFLYSDKSPEDKLTVREIEVLKLIGEGFSVKEISDKLNLSINTINTYRKRIMKKLNLKDGPDLARYSVKRLTDDSIIK